MKLFRISIGLIATLCFVLHFGFEKLRWPSMFNFLLIGIIISLVWLFVILFERFRSILARIIISFFGIVLITISLGFFRISNLLKESTAYSVTIREIRANSEILSIVGDSFIESKYVTGTLKENESDLFFSISGQGNKIKVHSKLKKDDHGNWKIVTMDLD